MGRTKIITTLLTVACLGLGVTTGVLVKINLEQKSQLSSLKENKNKTKLKKAKNLTVKDEVKNKKVNKNTIEKVDYGEMKRKMALALDAYNAKKQGIQTKTEMTYISLWRKIGKFVRVGVTEDPCGPASYQAILEEKSDGSWETLTAGHMVPDDEKALMKSRGVPEELYASE